MNLQKYIKSIYILIFVFVFSCKQEIRNTATEKLPTKQLLLNSIKAHNYERFYNATIQFNIDDYYYKMYRKDNIYNFELNRVHDSIRYKATSNNGFISYYINDTLQDESTYSRFAIENMLERVLYIFSIPHVFNQNAAKLKRLENVVIRKKEYFVIDISFTKINEDDPENKFILYINTKTYIVDYFAQKHNFKYNNKLIFNVANNFRIIQGIPFADYFVLTIDATNKKLNELYKLYNAKSLSLKELKPIIYSNIIVQLNTN